MKGWPARLTAGEVTLRPIEISDQGAWRSARQRNAAWLTPWDATVPPGGDARPLDVPAAGPAAEPAGPRRHDVPVRDRGLRPVRRPAHRQQHRARLGAVRVHGLLDRSRLRRPRRDAARRRDGDRPLLLHGRAAPRRDRDPARELQLAARGREARASARSGSRRGSCTSTAPGATTGSTPSPWRSVRRGCWPACRVRRPRVLNSRHTSCFATHLWTSVPRCASPPNL